MRTFPPSVAQTLESPYLTFQPLFLLCVILTLLHMKQASANGLSENLASAALGWLSQVSKMLVLQA